MAQKPAPRAAAGKKKQPPMALLGVAAAVAVVLLGIVGFVLLSGPRTGSLMISVPSAEGAEVRIDGQIVAQNQVIELPVGSHKLTATAPGRLPTEQVVTIAKGQSPQVVSLTLEAEPPADQPDSPTADDAQVATGTGTGTPSGTPSGSQPPETAAVQEPPKPTQFAAVFVGEAGAEVEVDGKRVGTMPNVKVADLSIGKTYAFSVKRAGYKTFSGKIRSKGETEVEVPFELEKEEPPPAPEPRQVAKQQPAPKTTTPPPAKPSRVAKGKLACSSRPLGAQIWVDGKYTGRDTPAALGNPLLLPVGSHSVVFKMDGKQSKPQTVNITEGGIAKLVNIPIE
jgi:hypothetical protein